MTCGEVTPFFPRRLDDDIGRQDAVHRTHNALCRDAPVRKEVHDLPHGVNTRISASCRRQFDRIAEDERKLFLQDVLHGADRRTLTLEAVVRRAVVGDGQTDVARARLHPFLMLALHAIPPNFKAASAAKKSAPKA